MQRPPGTLTPGRGFSCGIGVDPGSDDLHHLLDVAGPHPGMRRQRENTRGDRSGPRTGFLIWRQVLCDAWDVTDRGGIGRARDDSGLPESPEQTRAMSLVPSQDREAKIDGIRSRERPWDLDPLHAIDTCSQLIGMFSSNAVVGVQERKEQPCELPLVR